VVAETYSFYKKLHAKGDWARGSRGTIAPVELSFWGADSRDSQAHGQRLDFLQIS
jgi:hypothetical protein